MVDKEMQARIDEAADQVRENFTKNITEMNQKCEAKMNGAGEFDINTIESIWGKILRGNQEITQKLVGEAANGIMEKRLVEKKKKR